MRFFRLHLFRLTIAEDEPDKRAEGFQNLRSMLYGFIAALSIALVTGFWYGWYPRSINWNASQTILVLHLAAGVMALLLFWVFVVLHLKQKELNGWLVLAPWRLGTKGDAGDTPFPQRMVGLSLAWLLLLVCLSGLVLSLPGLLFFQGVVWMQGYALSQLLGGAHWLSALVLPLPLLLHLLWRPGRH